MRHRPAIAWAALLFGLAVGCNGQSTITMPPGSDDSGAPSADSGNDQDAGSTATNNDAADMNDGLADGGNQGDAGLPPDLGGEPNSDMGTGVDMAMPPDDDMGAPVCGNDILENGEVCDGDCPTDCPTAEACMTGSLTGSAQNCDAVCEFTEITACVDADGCCPDGCGVDDDDDCTAMCGDGVVETPEICDGDCPTACVPPDSCTISTLMGSAGTCDAECVDTDITQCVDGDGCCAPGCTELDDSDCTAICGNGVMESGELCDGDCPTSCTPPNACTTSVLSGSASTCDAMCMDAPITACVDGDGCCPVGCTNAMDDDCAPTTTCTPGDFASLLDTYTIANSNHSGPVFASPLSNGDVLVAYHDSGTIHVAEVGPDGTRRTTEHTTTGTRLYGLAAHPGGRAILVSRGSDVLALVAWDTSGAVQIDQTILGDVPHDVTNNEWFGPLLRAGRLAWTGSSWATYNTVQRLWPDGIAHYGDTLRYYDSTGAQLGGGWGWGCSHSMEVRISHNGTRTGPVCLSDCYPTKGVHFSHRQEELWTDPAANCAGGYTTELGASVPVSDGFWVLFAANDMRSSQDIALAKLDNAGDLSGSVVWHTSDAIDDAEPNAASYGSDLLVAWTSNGTETFVRADAATGAAAGSPTTVTGAGLSTASDFFTFSNGNVGWAFSSASDVALGVMSACP